MLTSPAPPLAHDAWPAPDGEPCVLPTDHPLAARYSVPRRLELLLPSREGAQLIHQRIPGSRTGERLEVIAPALPLHQVAILLENGAERYEVRMSGRSQAVVARPGQVTVMPAGMPSHWFGTTSYTPWLILYFSQRRLAEIVAEAGLPAGRAEPAPRIGQHDPGVAALAEALRIEQASHGVSAVYAAQWTMLVMLRLLGLDLPQPRRYALTPRRLAMVREFAEAHLAEDIGLEDLAGAAGLSRFHFARAFRHETGTSPSAWLRSVRSERARAMLAGTDLPVQAVARACGFVSAAHFSNAFRAAFGTTPSRWRAEHRL